MALDPSTFGFLAPVLRKIRECAMWTNVACTRSGNGAPLVAAVVDISK